MVTGGVGPVRLRDDVRRGALEHRERGDPVDDAGHELDRARAGPDHGVDPENDFFAYAESKTQADAHLAASDLGWTILRPSGLTEEAGTGGIETGPGVTGGQVARATVADVIAAAVDAPEAAKGLLDTIGYGHTNTKALATVADDPRVVQNLGAIDAPVLAQTPNDPAQRERQLAEFEKIKAGF